MDLVFATGAAAVFSNCPRYENRMTGAARYQACERPKHPDWRIGLHPMATGKMISFGKPSRPHRPKISRVALIALAGESNRREILLSRRAAGLLSRPRSPRPSAPGAGPLGFSSASR